MMKKNVFLIMALLALVAAALPAQSKSAKGKNTPATQPVVTPPPPATPTPAATTQYDSESDFQVTKAGNAITITKYVGKKTAVNIPPKIQNLPVTSIGRLGPFTGESTFESCVSVTIPDSVTSIGQSAFGSSTNLASVIIPNSVTSIGQSAFRNCTSLISVNIPNSVTSIVSGAFYGCTSLKSVTIGSGVTSIGNAVFDKCTNLTSVTFAGTIPSSGFGTNAVDNTFPSGLRAKFYATDAVNGTPGTYTKSGPTAGNVKGSTWAKQ